ncbi:MAG TPA: hypothetical protein VFB58_09505 [Chloroflexota bacterium]|nr:hypothetical protein [Chloroflexota bacterium]
MDGWGDRPLERAIFGTAESAEIAGMIDTFCREELGAAVQQCHVYESSQGAVAGLLLEDGPDVVIKAHPPGAEWTRERLAAVTRVQRSLTAAGIPAPPVVAGPAPLGNGWATVEAFVAEGHDRDGHDPTVRAIMARLLADIARLGRDLDVAGIRVGTRAHLERGELWPVPHSAIFDFAATRSGAEWIDALAERAAPFLLRPPGSRVLGHMDWSIKHFRFSVDRVTVIYDWDSLIVEDEPVIVGQTVPTYPARWDRPVILTPSLADARAFVAEYEAARGRLFTEAERATLGASALYALAYGARCEHAYAPAPPPYPRGSLRAALRDHGIAWMESLRDVP